MMSNNQADAKTALRFILKTAPRSFVLMVFMGLLNGAASIVSVWATERIFFFVSSGYSWELLSALILYAAAFLISAGYSVWYIRYHVQFFAIIDFEEKIRRMLHAKSRRISNEQLETPNAFAYIRQADNARQNLFRYGQIYVEAVMTLIQAAMVGAYISSFHLAFAFLLPLSVLPALMEMLFDTRQWKRGYEMISQCQREEAEYEKAVVDEVACKESRLTGADTLMISKWIESRKTRDSIEDAKSKKMLNLRLFLSILSCAGTVGGFVVSGLLYYSGQVGLSSFTAGVAAYTSLTAIIRGISGTAGNENQFRQMIQPFFRYWNMEERTGSSDKCSFTSTVSLSDVSFAYPNQKENALDHICLTIKKGETVAIVGENGAGKSTLVNVILGLYRPSSGRIKYDGEDISAVRETVLHIHQSALPQNFCRYKISAGDNIAIGDFSKLDHAQIDQRLSRLFPDGDITHDTLLGKEFGGRELSGGQWQQLSCERSFYKDSDFVVLDEPTSAIDPLREKALYARFLKELKGKTGIIVTHRLGAVQLADRIIVLSHGQLVENGTHKELLEANGLYASLWQTQVASFSQKA